MSDEVREFWINKPIGSGGDVLTSEMKNVIDSYYREDGFESSPIDKYIHVIEKSAYDELKAKVEIYTEALQQIANQRPHANAAIEMKNIAKEALEGK